MTGPTRDKATGVVNGVMPKPKPEFEVGVSAYLPFVTPFKNAWEALRNEDVTVRQLEAMRRTDGQARALYRLITLPIRAALRTATFVPETNVEGGEEEAAFIEQMLTLPASAGGMTVSFNRVIAQLLMAIFDGFTAFEMVYWSPTVGPLKGRWTLKKLAHRPSSTVTFLLDDNSEFAGLRQRTMYMNRSVDVVIPAEHVVYYAANEEEKPFYGQSYFQSAWYHWDKKFKLYVIAHIAAQRAAVGTRVGTLPLNPTREEKDEFKKALADLGVAQYIAVPEDYKVESLKEFTGFDFLAYINHHNSQMSKSILAAFFDDQQGSGGDTTLVDFGRQSDALFMMMLQTIMGEIEEVINNKIIPRFIDWNFGSQRYPKFQFGSLTEEQKAATVDLFKTLAVAGQSMTCSPEFVHELEKQCAEEFGLEIDYEAVEERLAEQAEIARQQQEQMLAGGEDPAAAAPGGPQQGGRPESGGGAVPAGPVHPEVNPSLLPRGFTLSNPDQDTLTLTDLAADLLAEAYDDMALTRGKSRQGYKVVKTPEGARVYGVPIGTPISRKIAERTAKEGVKGKPFGGVRGKDRAQNTSREVLGGGLGAKAQHPGGVAPEARDTLAPKRTLEHPDQPGVQLLDYGDGTVAVRDANGVVSPRQRFQITAFLRLGWQISHAQAGGSAKKADAPARKSAKKTTGPQGT